MRPLSIRIASTTPRSSRKGNRITALRWARLLRELGHRVKVEEQYTGGPCDVLIALHARRSLPSVERFRAAHPDKPLVLALTGTDLYRDIHTDARAREVLDWATRLVTLQPRALDELPRRLHARTRVILQSAECPKGPRPKPRAEAFEVCVLGHLRPVKDPFRAAEAVQRLPEDSRLRVLHIGGALSGEMEERARAEEASNPRYRWLGEVPRTRALRRLAGTRLLVLTSISEGGANAVSEAIACGVPVVSSRISGSVGLLGRDYPGYFRVGDTRGLARLLRRVETDPRFYAELQRRCRKLARQVEPRREREAWARLLAELKQDRPRPPARPVKRPVTRGAGRPG
jgi:putative glycosyltransferase (TIGR04348 family)